MAATDPITSITGLAGLSGAGASPSAAANSDVSAASGVVMNDPIMDVKLLASLPANLGRNMDLSA